MNYSCVCRRTRSRGLRFETKRSVGEIGRSWNLPLRNELNAGSEFCKQLDQYLTSANSTHLVYINYYIEVSEAKLSSYQNQIRSNPESISETFKGGLQVLSESSHVTEEKKLANKKVVAKEQIKLASSKFCTRESCEVQLCFKYEPGNTYSLHVYGPIFGGRVSISSARIRKVSDSSQIYISFYQHSVSNYHTCLLNHSLFVSDMVSNTVRKRSFSLD